MNNNGNNDLGGVPIHERDIELDAPLPWSVYDKTGHLLLREGSVVSSAQQRARLVARGLYRQAGLSAPGRRPQPPPEPDPGDALIPVQELVQGLIERLAAAYRQLVKGETDGLERLLRLARDIRGYCRSDADAILGTLQMNLEGSYGLVHPLHAGVLCALTVDHLGLEEGRCVAVTAGALSHDVGMLADHDTLQRRRGPLSPEEWTQVRDHPAAGVALLRRAGVEDPDWLDVVMHHHERLDGSGYPDGLRGDALSRTARLLAIADIYSAMIRPRPYREAILAKTAMRDIFLARGETIDPELAQAFIKDMGVFPPGAVVRLSSGEIGVVVRRATPECRPQVASVIGVGGQLQSRPLKCACESAGCRITEMLPLGRFRSVTRYLGELWQPLVPPMAEAGP